MWHTWISQDDVSHENIMQQASNPENLNLDPAVAGPLDQHQPVRRSRRQGVPDGALERRAMGAVRADRGGRTLETGL
jgi:hypothetical protein